MKQNLDPNSPAERQGAQQRGGRLGGRGRDGRRTAPRHRPHRPCCQQKAVGTIAAHEGTLAAIAFNASGSRLASASEKVSAARGRVLGAPLCQGCAGSWAPRTCWNSLQRAALAPACPPHLSSPQTQGCCSAQSLAVRPRTSVLVVTDRSGFWEARADGWSMPAPWAWLGRDRQTEGVQFTFQEQLTQHVDSRPCFLSGVRSCRPIQQAPFQRGRFAGRNAHPLSLPGHGHPGVLRSRRAEAL